MTNTPNPKKIDSLGRIRLPKEEYSQGGGRLSPRYFVWTCKQCSKAWNVRSCSPRYDAKCRGCGTRNSIMFTSGKGVYYQGRERVTKFDYYPNSQEASHAAISHNMKWMKRRIAKCFQDELFTTANLLNKPRGSIDREGHAHPLTKEMSE